MNQTKEFIEKVQEICGVDISDCYQCGKCSAGCPSAQNMSIMPNMVIRKIQRGQEDAIKEEAIWKCTSCMTCWSRCPRDVNLCSIMESLRILYMQEFKDKYSVEEFTRELLKRIPQQGIVAGFRKFTY